MNLKQKTAISSTIFTILILCLIFFGIWPVFDRIKQDSEKLLELKKKELSFEKNIQNSDELKNLFSAFGSDLEKFKSFLIDVKVPLEFIEFLENTAEDNNLTIEISPVSSRAEEKEYWLPVGFQVEALGSFDSCLKFIDTLESAPYLLEIQNIALRKLNEKELASKTYEDFSQGDGILNLSLKVFGK